MEIGKERGMEAERLRGNKNEKLKVRKNEKEPNGQNHSLNYQFSNSKQRLCPFNRIWHQHCSDDMVCTRRQEVLYIYVAKMICAIFNLAKMKQREDQDPGERNLDFHSSPHCGMQVTFISSFTAQRSVPSLIVHEIIWEICENASAHT